MTYPGDEGKDLENDEEFEGAFEEDGLLDLDDDDGELPWLEAEDYEEEGGFDFRLIWVALVGLLIIAAILFAGWWFTREVGNAEAIPDGSTIEAPEEAYKQRPDNPGGREVAGTGDQAFEVAEGQSTRGRLATDDGGDSDVRPSINVDQAGTAPTPTATTPAAPAAGGAYIQIGAFGSRADADAAWARETARFSALSGLRHRVVEAEVNGANVFRLQAIAGDREAAATICRSIRNSGGDCIVR